MIHRNHSERKLCNDDININQKLLLFTVYDWFRWARCWAMFFILIQFVVRIIWHVQMKAFPCFYLFVLLSSIYLRIFNDNLTEKKCTLFIAGKNTLSQFSFCTIIKYLITNCLNLTWVWSEWFSKLWCTHVANVHCALCIRYDNYNLSENKLAQVCQFQVIGVEMEYSTVEARQFKMHVQYVALYVTLLHRYTILNDKWKMANGKWWWFGSW